MVIIGFRKCAVVEAEPWGGLGEEQNLAESIGFLQALFVEVEPWGGLGEERGSLPPRTE